MSVENTSPARVRLALIILADIADHYSRGGISMGRHMADALRGCAHQLILRTYPEIEPNPHPGDLSREEIRAILKTPPGPLANQPLLFSSSELSVRDLPNWLLIRVILSYLVTWLTDEETDRPTTHLPGRRRFTAVLHILGMPDWPHTYEWRELYNEAQERLIWQGVSGRVRLYTLNKNSSLP